MTTRPTRKEKTFTDRTGLTMTVNVARKFDSNRNYRFYALYPANSPFPGEIKADSRVSWNRLESYYHEQRRIFGQNQAVEDMLLAKRCYTNMFELGSLIEEFVGLP